MTHNLHGYQQQHPTHRILSARLDAVNGKAQSLLNATM